MRHGDAHRVIAAGNGGGGQTVALGAQDDGQPGIPQGQRVAGQGHGRCFEAQAAQNRYIIDPGPRHLEHGTHAHPDGPAVQRVAAPFCQKHRVHAQRRRGAEDSAHIGGIHDVFQHSRPAGAPADLLSQGKRGPAHGAQHSPGQLEAYQPGEHIKGGCINGDVSAAGDQVSGLGLHVPVLHQKGAGHAPGIQRPADDIGTFCDEQALLGMLPAQQLIFRQAGVNVQLRGGKVVDGDDVGHGGLLLRGDLKCIHYNLQAGCCQMEGYYAG